MPRRPGARPGTVSRRGRSASVASADVRHASDVQLCGACCKDVGEDAIGCDECEVWVHNTVMCSGLSQDMIDAIGRYNGNGIKFVCTKCRLDFSTKRGCSPSSSTETHLVELISHLSQQIKGICNQVQELKNEIKDLRSQPRSSHPPPDPVTLHPPAPSALAATRPYASAAVPALQSSQSLQSSQEYRKVVREELRELQEQQKRRTSIIIRGLGASSASEAVTKFEAVSDHLIHQRVTLTDVVKIPSENDLYRGKVSDDELRKLILDSCRQLRHSDRFGSVFIRRDLTFHQRAELRARRAAAGTAAGANGAGSPQPAGDAPLETAAGSQRSLGMETDISTPSPQESGGVDGSAVSATDSSLPRPPANK